MSHYAVITEYDEDIDSGEEGATSVEWSLVNVEEARAYIEEQRQDHPEDHNTIFTIVLVLETHTTRELDRTPICDG